MSTLVQTVQNSLLGIRMIKVYFVVVRAIFGVRSKVKETINAPWLVQISRWNSKTWFFYQCCTRNGSVQHHMILWCLLLPFKNTLRCYKEKKTITSNWFILLSHRNKALPSTSWDILTEKAWSVPGRGWRRKCNYFSVLSCRDAAFWKQLFLENIAQLSHGMVIVLMVLTCEFLFSIIIID